MVQVSVFDTINKEAKYSLKVRRLGEQPRTRRVKILEILCMAMQAELMSW